MPQVSPPSSDQPSISELLQELTTHSSALAQTTVAGWLAALIVAVVYLASAGVLVLLGRSRVKGASPPIPEQTVESVKEDLKETKDKAKGSKSMSAKDKASTTTSDSPTGGSDKDARTPEEIRSDIDQTREELGETVAAVADKADLKKQAKAKADELKAQQFAQANPVPLAIGGAFIAGFVLGRILSR